jgi:hypothetical protein
MVGEEGESWEKWKRFYLQARKIIILKVIISNLRQAPRNCNSLINCELYKLEKKFDTLLRKEFNFDALISRGL